MTTKRIAKKKPYKKKVVKKEENHSISATHGCATIFTGQDGIKRQIGIARFSENHYEIILKTYWDGEDKEPMETRVHLRREAISALATGLSMFLNRMDDFSAGKNK